MKRDSPAPIRQQKTSAEEKALTKRITVKAMKSSTPRFHLYEMAIHIVNAARSETGIMSHRCGAQKLKIEASSCGQPVACQPLRQASGSIAA
eukprot:961428-Rhodomonas_salina.4